MTKLTFSERETERAKRKLGGLEGTQSDWPTGELTPNGVPGVLPRVSAGSRADHLPADGKSPVNPSHRGLRTRQKAGVLPGHVYARQKHGLRRLIR